MRLALLVLLATSSRGITSPAVSPAGACLGVRVRESVRVRVRVRDRGRVRVRVRRGLRLRAHLKQDPAVSEVIFVARLVRIIGYGLEYGFGLRFRARLG